MIDRTLARTYSSESNYDSTFMDYATALNAHSADCVVNVVSRILQVESVVDIGCAQGSWLAAWLKAGVDDILGVDGSYVDTDRLVIEQSKFVASDLAQPLDLRRTFSIAQSVEVAEHLPQTAAKSFIGSIVRHAPIVLFAAAPPGQGGHGHINEQSYAYWRDLFAEHGYEMFDCIRPRLAHDKTVQPWYRYNTFLFAHAAAILRLPRDVQNTRVPPGGPVRDISPLLYRIRKLLVRCLPLPIQNLISSLIARTSHRQAN